MSVRSATVTYALIIEDNHLIAMMIREELAENGFDSIDIATSEQQAIAMATRRCPDLITVDDKLESGTGLATIQAICNDRAIPVVFVTAEGRSIKMSIPDAIVVPKPFSGRQLMAAVETAIAAPTRVGEVVPPGQTTESMAGRERPTMNLDMGEASREQGFKLNGCR